MANRIDSLGDVNIEPYWSAMNRRFFIPNTDDLKKDVERRAIVLN
jgi:hypothetical protein